MSTRIFYSFFFAILKSNKGNFAHRNIFKPNFAIFPFSLFLSRHLRFITSLFVIFSLSNLFFKSSNLCLNLLLFCHGCLFNNFFSFCCFLFSLSSSFFCCCGFNFKFFSSIQGLIFFSLSLGSKYSFFSSFSSFKCYSCFSFSICSDLFGFSCYFLCINNLLSYLFCFNSICSTLFCSLYFSFYLFLITTFDLVDIIFFTFILSCKVIICWRTISAASTLVSVPLDIICTFFIIKGRLPT